MQKFPAARKRNIDNKTPLLEAGIVDSMGVLDVVAFLEQAFKIAISDEELTPENFADIDNMASFVQGKMEGSRAVAK